MNNPYSSDGNGHIRILLMPYNLGVFTIVDEQDLPLVKDFNWKLSIAGHRKQLAYAVSKMNGKNISLHRLLITSECKHVDHINGDGLDNRKANIRPATQGQNLMNRGKQINNTSGYKGVSRTGKDKWKAMIQFEGKDYYAGSFKTKEEAALAYDKKAKELFGEFAKTNF